MPKGIRNTKAQGGQQFSGRNADADLTVYHFANAEPGRVKTGRMSKAAINWTPTAKQLSGGSMEPDNALAWYERDISSFDLSDSDECEPDLRDSENKSESEQDHDDPSKKNGIGRRRRKKLLVARLNAPGQVYHLDLWFLIGSWVNPEHVGTFAGICRSAHIVTHTARFWYRIYQRSHYPEADLPATLQPQSMERVHGLRARVIRALFLMYLPFQQRLRTRAPFEQDPDDLKGACCTLMWYEKVKTHWNFHYKFLLPHNEKFACPFTVDAQKHSRKISPLHREANIHHNTEGGYCVLQVVTQNFIPLPPSLMGQILAKSSVGISHDLRHHKLKLIFSPQHYTPQGCRKSEIASGTTVVMDPVLNLYILNWWDPRYPHQPV